ncbi:MAG: patatin-like phospholipase family protein [Leptospiraceae bacterium]|nr:patatin-like phospholipase family protein [Leptospiraceae bacterium]
MLPPFHHRKRRGRALIVEGGGMRGAFSGGALAGLAMEKRPPEYYDIVVGVSSGSCSAAYYVTGTTNSRAAISRFLMVWRHELIDSKLISLRNLLHGRPPLDQEYLVDDLFGQKYRIERERLYDRNRPPFYIVVSNIETRQAEFIRATGANLLRLLKAATSLPIATRGRRRMGAHTYTDGGVLEPLPVQRLIDAGYTEITVVLTNPRHFRQEPTGKLLSWMCFPRNPQLAHLLHTKQHLKHQAAYQLINNPPPGVEITIIDPPGTLPVSMIGSNALQLNDSVDIGIARASEILRNSKQRLLGKAGWLQRLIPFPARRQI